MGPLILRVANLRSRYCFSINTSSTFSENQFPPAVPTESSRGRTPCVYPVWSSNCTAFCFQYAYFILYAVRCGSFVCMHTFFHRNSVFPAARRVFVTITLHGSCACGRTTQRARRANNNTWFDWIHGKLRQWDDFPQDCFRAFERREQSEHNTSLIQSDTTPSFHSPCCHSCCCGCCGCLSLSVSPSLSCTIMIFYKNPTMPEIKGGFFGNKSTFLFVLAH